MKHYFVVSIHVPNFDNFVVCRNCKICPKIHQVVVLLVLLAMTVSLQNHSFIPWCVRDSFWHSGSVL